MNADRCETPRRSPARWGSLASPDALALVALYAITDDAKFEPAAIKLLGRLSHERSGLTLSSLQLAAAALAELGGRTRRWVAVPDWLMADVADTCAREDRTHERRVFQGFTADVANVMARACKGAGIAHYHPHDLRPRYASVKIAEGCRSRKWRRSWGTRRRA